tara:strand:- start:276 stop:1313 length:1038 start_codon:yes stop_codon:yes gene_type:complete
MPEFNSFIINSIKRITHDSVILSLKIKSELKGLYQFSAGQYVTLEIEINGESVRRSYSICSEPNAELFEVGIKKVQNGIFSTYVNEKLRIGDSIKVGTPEGRFIWEPNENDKIMAIAAGSGITPIMSIIKSVIKQSEKSSVTLIYCNKSPEKTMFYKELQLLVKHFHNRLNIHWTFTQTNEKGANFGRVDENYINFALNQGKAKPNKYFLCGPEKMIDLSKKFLKKKGILENQIFYELFTESSNKKEIDDAINTGVLNIKYDDVFYKLSLNAEKTILDIALQAKIDVPYSCQGGVCCSCIGKITEGEAKMKSNQVLTDEEINEGLVLTCQAVSISDKITIDYDDV